MSKAVATKIIGLGEFKEQLKRISGAVRGEMLAQAVTAGLQLVVNAAKAKAPKRTGELKRSIHTQVEQQRADYAEVAAGTDMIYGPIQEFGGVIVPKESNKSGWLVWKDAKSGVWHKARSVTIPAHPYLRPAWDENIDKVITEVKTALIDLIKAAV
jgi:HK97 gp10 family phage protein